jgi:iron complex outermembrane recepter protein
MKHFFTLPFLMLLGQVLIGQSVSISVRDNQKNPLAGATVSLTSISDSSVVFASTNLSGVAEFKSVEKGLYQLSISYIGFETLEKSLNIKSESERFDYRLSENAFALDEITISAERPLIRYEYDKMIIDPEPIADISTNTLEVLENTPGLFVDQDGGIFLSSASPAVVYINGREQKMSNQDITTLLRSIPPGSIERIEVMRTPSTKYDAASSGGIINIILKKGVKIGRFGTIRAGMNQGVKGNRFAGISFNNSGDKSTSYLNLNYNYNDRLEEINMMRPLMSDTSLNQNSDTRHKNDQFYAAYGINYDISENLSANYDGRINFSLRNSETENINLIFGGENLLISEIENNVKNDSEFLSLQQDFGLVYKLDTIGSDWDTKISYSLNSGNNLQDYYYVYNSPIIYRTAGDGKNTQSRHFLVFQSDITKFFANELKLETGIKSSYQHYDSDADYFYDFDTIRIKDTERTNAFFYQENINAAYSQLSFPIGEHFSMIGGLRFEHTYMKGNQTIPSDTSFIVNRADLFPYVYLSRKIFEGFGIELRSFIIYRRTINRPGYHSLNPYVKFVDQFLYETGNPALKPQFTDNIELNISYENFPVFAIGRNYTTDIFSSVIYLDPENELTAVRTYDNLGKSTETYFRAMAGIPPGKRYFFAIGAQYNHNDFVGVYEDEAFEYSRGGWRFFTFHSLKLWRDAKLTLSGFMMTNGIYNNFYELNTFGTINLGITQTFFDKKLTITINARDLLRTMVTEFTYNQGNIYTTGDRYADNRRFGINIRYNFGIRKKEENGKNMMQFDFDEQQ